MIIIERINKRNIKKIKDSDFKQINKFKKKNINIVSFVCSDKMNTMDITMLSELLDIINNKTSKDFFVFKGDKDNKIFCSGANLKFFYEIKDNPQLFEVFGDLAYYIIYKFFSELSKNSLFLWNGVVMGGGLGIGIYAKYRIATESTILAMPESIFGWFANCLFSQFICKFVSKIEAIHMSLFAHKYVGYEAYQKNFATHFILNKYIDNLLQDLQNLDDPIENYTNIDTILNHYHIKSVEEFTEKKKVESRLKEFDLKLAKIYDFKFEDDDFLKFYNNLSKKLQDIGLIHLYKELKEKNEVCLNVNFNVAVSSYNINLSFEDRLDRDLYYTEALIQTGDMFEGIRAYFLEKDKKPKWKAKF